MTSRIDKLTSVQQEILKIASVIGVEFPLTLLEQVAPAGYSVELVRAEVRSLERRGLVSLSGIEPEVMGRFRHTAMQVCLRLFVCLFVCLLVCLRFCLFVCLFVCFVRPGWLFCDSRNVAMGAGRCVSRAVCNGPSCSTPAHRGLSGKRAPRGEIAAPLVVIVCLLLC